MKLKKNIIRILCLLVVASSNAYGRTTKIKLGEVISREISASENHSYEIRLKKDQFVVFKVLQKGIDLKLITYTIAGEQLGAFDSPNYRNGYEMGTLYSTKAGTYTLEITSIDQKEHSGAYDLVVTSITPKATTKSGKVDELFARWNTQHSPGASIAIIEQGALVYQKGYGMANLEYDVPIDANSVFHIASVSKQFTIFALLLLEQQGKLSLEDDVRDYLKEVPDFGAKITLRHLASHTSGLRDQWNLLGLAGWRMDDIITKEHILKLLRKQKELNFNPGEEYAYSNTGYTLLAEVVARVSGMPFVAFTRENIFKPLGMGNTRFSDDHEQIVLNKTYSYRPSPGGYKKSVLNYSNAGATSLLTTAEDLSKWVLNFSNTTVGSAKLFHTMNALTVLNNGTTFGGALGQFVGDYKGLKEIEHSGADAGYRAFLTRFPDEDFSVIILSNLGDFDPVGMAHKVVDLYLADRIDHAAPKAVKATTTGTPPPPVVKEKQFTLDALRGHYEIRPGLTLKVSVAKDTLTVQQLWNKNSFHVLAATHNTYVQQGNPDFRFSFSQLENGFAQRLKITLNGNVDDCKRVVAFDPARVDLAAYVGTFYSEELSTTYTLSIENGQLIAKHYRVTAIPFTLTNTDTFLGKAWFMGVVTFTRNEAGEVSGFKVSNGRVRNLFFTKVD